MDEEKTKRKRINGTQKLQGWVAKEDADRVDYLIEQGYIINPSDAVREGVRALWREYQKGNLAKIKEEAPEAPTQEAEASV